MKSTMNARRLLNW